MYRDHRKGPGGPPGGATYPGGPHKLKWEGNLLGFIVISKKFLRTRKIMVMHSNERGECDLRTLVDRQRKR